MKTLASLIITCAVAAASAQSPPPLPVDEDLILNTWLLDNPPLWTSSFGDAPRSVTNVVAVPGWSFTGLALMIDTNVPAWLNYDMYNADGSTNVTFDSGSIALWFQPNFTSVNDGGDGPGEWASLFTVGNFTTNAADGCWSLAIDPGASNLVFVAQTNCASQLVFSTPIDWFSNDWHHIVVAYTPTNCALFLEGSLATNAAPAAYWPSPSECLQDGLWIGSTKSGDSQGHGVFLYARTYDFPLDPDYIQSVYDNLAARISDWGGSLPVTAGMHPDDGPPGLPGGGTNFGGGGGPVGQFQTNNFVVTTNYLQATNFWLTLSVTNTNCYVAIQSTLSNLTYVILTNDVRLALTNWGVWQTLLATSSVTPAPPMSIGSNSVLFKAELFASTGTNSLPDWWCMNYFHTLAVDPFADPDGDGLCNWDECYITGTNPTNTHSISSAHTDSQAWLLAYTNDPACIHQLSLSTTDTNSVLLTLTPTLVGTNYQIYTKDLSTTNSAWIVETNFLGTNAETSVAIALNGRTLAFIGGYGEDDDGDGLPSGYEALATHTDPYLYDTGNTGTNDANKDPDGDGYINIVEYNNGTDPLRFDTPAPTAGLYADYTGGGSGITIGWQPSPGPVLYYLISITDSGGAHFFTNGPSSLAFSYSHQAVDITSVSVSAIYVTGAGLPSTVDPSDSLPAYTTAMSAINGPGGHLYLVSPTNLPQLKGFQLSTSINQFFWFLDVFSGMRGPLDGLGRQGFGPCGPETQAFKEVEWRLAMVPDSADPLKTSRKHFSSGFPPTYFPTLDPGRPAIMALRGVVLWNGIPITHPQTSRCRSYQ